MDRSPDRFGSDGSGSKSIRFPVASCFDWATVKDDALNVLSVAVEEAEGAEERVEEGEGGASPGGRREAAAAAARGTTLVRPFPAAAGGGGAAGRPGKLVKLDNDSAQNDSISPFCNPAVSLAVLTEELEHGLCSS